jgi:hypothetical protein
MTTHSLNLQFQQLGLYYVLGKGQQTAHGQFWICECQGQRHEQSMQVQIHEAALVEGRALGCGCTYVDKLGRHPRSFQDLTGQECGHYLVQSFYASTREGAVWECLCLCHTIRHIKGGRTAISRRNQCIRCAGHTRERVMVHRWYGSWFVLQRVADKGSRPTYLCRCNICGIKKQVQGKELLDGGSTSCGCSIWGWTEPMLHKQFGRLTVLELVESGNRGKKRYLCQCSCIDRTIKIISAKCLRNGDTQSCGCLAKERGLQNIMELNKTRAAVTRLDWTLDVMRQHAEVQS